MAEQWSVSGTGWTGKTVGRGLLITAAALGVSLVLLAVGAHPFGLGHAAVLEASPVYAASSPGLADQRAFSEPISDIQALQITPHGSTRVMVPAIDSLDGWETQIDVQNVGPDNARAVMFVWGGYSGSCGGQAFGPVWALCTGLLRPGSAWIWPSRSLPAWGGSAIVYSVDFSTSDDACEEAADVLGDVYDWKRWENRYEGTGQPIAVSVNRVGPAQTLDITVASAYTGISQEMTGVYDSYSGGFMYYTPLNFNDYHGLTTTTIVQNGGGLCTSLEIWYKIQDDCLRSNIEMTYSLAPGEAVRISPPGLPPGTQGSAWIRASQPLGVVVDEVGRDLLMTYRGVPADVFSEDFSAGSMVNYAPLTYREYNGWDTGIQVQNLSSVHNAKAAVSFLDRGGHTLTTIVDWICPRGSQTFFLPAVANLPGQYLGAVVISSLNWWTPGGPFVDAPRVTSIINLINYNTGQALAYNALTAQMVEQIGAVGIPVISRQSEGISTEIGIQNINPSPGRTRFFMGLSDTVGRMSSFCFSLSSGQVIYFSLDNLRYLPAGFRGSVAVVAVSSSQAGGPAVGAVSVERGSWTGDISKATEGSPIATGLFDPPPGCVQ